MLFFLCIIWLSVTFAFFKSSGQTQPFLRNTFASKFEILPTTAASKPVEKIILRDTSIKVTSDVRGNLGPASVIIQNPPRKNWINDRWQAASNMHGLSIPGQHWVVLDFIINTTRHIIKVVIDWALRFQNIILTGVFYLMGMGKDKNRSRMLKNMDNLLG